MVKFFFVDDGLQNHLTFQLLYNTLNRLTGAETIVAWKSKCLFSGGIVVDNSLSPKIKWYGASKICLKFNRSYLKQDIPTFTPPNVVIIFNFYELDIWSQDFCWFYSKRLFVWNC